MQCHLLAKALDLLQAKLQGWKTAPASSMPQSKLAICKHKENCSGDGWGGWQVYILKFPGQDGQKGKARKKAGLRGTGQGRGGWLCGPCAAHVTPLESMSGSRAEANTIILGRNTTR